MFSVCPLLLVVEQQSDDLDHAAPYVTCQVTPQNKIAHAHHTSALGEHAV